MSNELQQLTVKEAIEQGYTRYSADNTEYIYYLSDVLEQPDFDQFEWILIDKEPTFLTVSPEEIYNDLAENFAINRDVDDDNCDISDAIIEAVDWDTVAAQITEKLKEHPIYYPTKIKLIP